MQKIKNNTWQKVKLGAVATLHRGYDLPAEQMERGEYPVIFSNGKIERHKEYKIPGPGVVTGRSGTLGNIFYIKENFWPHNTTLYVSDFHGNNPKFIYFLLKRLNFARFNAGSGVPTLNRNHVHGILVEVPEDSIEQERITDILSAFDDKIELNNKISKNLEQTAQTIFKEWFVNFKFPSYEKVKMVDSELGKIPEGWEVKKFGELLKLKHGHGYKSEEFDDERTNRILVRMGNFKETGGLQFDDNTKYLKSDVYNKKDQLMPNDLVMVLSDITRDGRIIGSVGLIPDDNHIYLLNQRVAKIETEEKFKLFLYFYFNSKKFKEHCLSRADSATVLNLKSDHIYEIKMAVPDDNTLDKFNALVLPIFRKSREIENENQKLAALRNLLLPKLMSGDV